MMFFEPLHSFKSDYALKALDNNVFGKDLSTSPLSNSNKLSIKYQYEVSSFNSQIHIVHLECCFS